jgi:hypothetical protein
MTTFDDPLESWAIELGVQPEVMQRLVEQRRALAYDIASAPREWGFDLVPASAQRRDARLEFRRRTRLTGRLGESFLVGDPTFASVVPTALTFDDGQMLVDVLTATCGLNADLAAACERQLRMCIVERLGQPLVLEDVANILREVAWDFGHDPATLISVTRDVFASVSS